MWLARTLNHMTWHRFRDRDVARRINVVDTFDFPSSVRQRFAYHHDQFGSSDIRMVEAATRQWFRLTARHPKAKLSMPSVAVDELWHELVLHTREYAAFCQAAFGHFLHHEPESAMTSIAATANRSTFLLATLNLAQLDENCVPPQLPLLFRVDKELGMKDGRRYLAGCGGRGECFPVPGTICLQHLAGVGKPLRFEAGGSFGGPAVNPPPSFGCGCSGGGG